MNFNNLEKNICDTIKEGQIKIGYYNNDIRLYYPVDSISDLLEIQRPGIEEMNLILEEFKEKSKERLGNVEISHKDERFCFKIPDVGTKYVHEIYKDNPFLRMFLETITLPKCDLQDILKVFHSFSNDIHLEIHEEMGDIIYFEDENIDEYVYCLKFDEFGATYHRFTKYDFKKLQ